ncbi:MAG: peptide-binding protein [Campylobacteraceae bacterium]|jgi:peptide/nickel transport system substrate-binding protein|nr:peptide-binding protein [Campylobacteraceae bacterium]
MKILITLFILIQLSLCASLHIGMSANPSRINPILSTDTVSSEIAQYIFNSLITYDENASIKLELAKSYRFLDNKTLLFTLRDDVFWSDGKSFGAQDVIFTYETITSPTVFTPYAESFRHVEKVEAIDNFSVKVTYKYPYFAALETWTIGILPYHILKNENSIMTSAFNQKPIGTGAFILKDFSISSNFILEANKNYFLGSPKLERIIYHFAPDSATEFLMLKSGELDIGAITSLQVKRQLDKKFYEQFNIYETMSHSYSYVGFNLNLPKFQDAMVREALSLAIDRQELIDLLLFGDGVVCTGPFMPQTKTFNPDVKVPQRDTKKAKELLFQAGYSEKNPLKFELLTNSGSRIYIAQILQRQLKDVGVHVSVRVMEWQAFLNTVIHPRRFEAIVMGWQMGLKSDAYSIWHSESAKIGGFNLVGYKNEEVDTLIKKAERTIDEEEFNAIYRRIFKLIKDDNPYLFLYIPKTLTAVKKSISPIRPSIIGIEHNIIEWTKDE